MDAGFAEWFSGSRVVDEDGRPRVVYRGQHSAGAGWLHTRLPSITFTECPEVARIYADSPNRCDDIPVSPRVLCAHVRIRRPILESEDPFIDFSDVADKLGTDLARRLALAHYSAIHDTNNWQELFSGRFRSVAEALAADRSLLRSMYCDAYRLLDDPVFVAAAKAAGFDGAIHVGNGESGDVFEYRIFDEAQAWPVGGGLLHADQAPRRRWHTMRAPG